MAVSPWRGLLLAGLLAVALVSMGLPKAQAEVIIGISGTFYQQHFRIPQGSSAGGSDVYLVVFNTGTVPFVVDLSYQAPREVSVTFSANNFALQPGANKQVYTTVTVGRDAVPGNYEVQVNAEARVEAVAGQSAVGSAAGLVARLTVTGEFAEAEIVLVAGPEREPVVAETRLFQVVEGGTFEVARQFTDRLEVKVAPGQYIASVYMAGEKVAQESFALAPSEEKRITMVADVVFFESFDTVTVYKEGTREIVFVKVVYTVKNLYRPLPGAEVVLVVTFKPAAAGAELPAVLTGARDLVVPKAAEAQSYVLETVVMASLAELSQGRTSSTYNYIPSGGWKAGTYGFDLQLRAAGKTYTTTAKELPREEPGVLPGTKKVEMAPSAPAAPALGPWQLWLAVGLLIVALGAVLFIFVVLRRGARRSPP